MPDQIPILYTGLNAARPDFKSMTQNINASFDRARQRKQQQSQFDALKNERQTKEFLKNLDTDALNSANAGLMQQKTNLTEGLTQGLTDMLKESDGVPTTENQVAARLAMSETNQQINNLNEQAKNWKIDMKAFADNPDIYDHSKADIITGWDGSQDDPYTESRLDQTYIERSKEENRARTQADMADPDTFRAIGNIGGKDVPTESEYDAYYFDNVDGNLVPKYANQVGFLKAAMSKDGQGATITQQTYDREYQKAIAGKPEVKELYEQIALNSTGNKEDAEYIYELDQAEKAGSSYFPKGEEKAAKIAKVEETKIKTPGGKSVIDLNQIDTQEQSWGDGSTSKQYVSFGGEAKKAIVSSINGATDKSKGTTLDKTLSEGDFTTADLVGVDYSGDDPQLHFRVKFKDKKKQGEDGGDVYVYGRYPEGTQEQIEDSIREKYIKGVKDNASTWRKRKDIKLTDEEQTKLDAKIDEFDSKLDNGDVVPLMEENRTMDVLAPVSENPAYSKLYINKQGIQKEAKKEVQELTQEAWNTKWNNLNSGETLTGLDGVEYTKK